MNFESKSRPRILLVDDDIEFRTATELAIKNHDYDVISAGGVIDAIAHLKKLT